MRINTDILPNDIPAIKIKLSGVDGDYLAMIDTGSAITMFDETVIEAMLYETTSACSMEITGICGTSDTSGSLISGIVTTTNEDGDDVHIKLEGATYDMSGITKYYNENYNINTEFAVLIGSDTLSALKAKVDYENKFLIIENEKEGADE